MPRRKTYFNDKEINDLFYEWLKMRVKIRKPATDYAIELAIKKLRELSNNKKGIAIQILKNSIFHSWQGLYPINNGIDKREYSYNQVCDLIANQGYKMEHFQRIQNTEFYIKIK